MSGHPKPYHRGAHQARAKRINNTANANPSTTCAKCGNTLDKCGPRGNGYNRNGTPCTWQAGHIIDGTNAGYQHECSHCNASTGATMGNRKRLPEPREQWP